MSHEIEMHAHEPRLDTELQIAGQPSGIMEAYHVGLNVFGETLDLIAQCIPTPDRENVINAIHKAMAGVAIYAYRAGVRDTLQDKGGNDD